MATIDAMHSLVGEKTQAVIDVFDRYVVPNYRRYPVCLDRGVGSRVWDAEGAEYLDLFPGWGCNLLGHCPEHVVRAVQEQVAKLIHVPNTWYIEPQGKWAQMLSERSFGGQAFFCNSGTEANEAAIKLVRLRSEGKRYKIITFTGGFHGRTMGAVSATAQPKYHEGLGPMVAGFQYAPHGDLDAVPADLGHEVGRLGERELRERLGEAKDRVAGRARGTRLRGRDRRRRGGGRDRGQKVPPGSLAIAHRGLSPALWLVVSQARV